uniref:ShKT domain-containing protein n=1 Tax=Angiostrongylus cantonensis TaxID=6313 RepID=A0A0K0DQM4_ANGCA
MVRDARENLDIDVRRNWLLNRSYYKKRRLISLFSCSLWVANGFCTSTFYTEEKKRQYCGKACNLC